MRKNSILIMTKLMNCLGVFLMQVKSMTMQYFWKEIILFILGCSRINEGSSLLVIYLFCFSLYIDVPPPFMKFCVLEYRPWRCMAEVCPLSSSLLLPFPANETVHSDSSLVLIKTLHLHLPPKNPKKHHHRFYKFFFNQLS